MHLKVKRKAVIMILIAHIILGVIFGVTADAETQEVLGVEMMWWWSIELTQS